MMTDSDLTISTTASVSGTAKIARLYRLGTRRMARAHVALQRRPHVAQAMSDLAGQVAQALNAQLGTKFELEARLLDASFILERTLASAGDACWFLLSLDAAGAPAVVEVEYPVLSAALARLSGGSARPTPVAKLTRIEEAAFGFLSLIALQAARRSDFSEKHFAPRLKRVNAARDEVLANADGKEAHLCVQLKLTVGDVEGQGRLFVPARAIQSCVQGEPSEPAGALSEEVASAVLSLRTFIGHTRLDASELSALNPGDVVLFDGVSTPNGTIAADGRLSTRGFELFGRFAEDGFHLTRFLARVFPQESSMSRSAPKDETPALPVEVEIELTRLRLTVGELAGIRPGSILPLHINAAEPVLLRVGDRAVARAELVEIEGEVGARILTLLS